MKKIYDKDEVNFSLIWIGIYVVLFSVAENLSASIGIEKVITAPFSVALTIIMFAWLPVLLRQLAFSVKKQRNMGKYSLPYWNRMV